MPQWMVAIDVVLHGVECLGGCAHPGLEAERDDGTNAGHREFHKV
jgi:hypothetical protein